MCYLPDIKYYSDILSKKYSNVDKYFEIATKAIKEMYKQVGQATFNEDGIIQKGVIYKAFSFAKPFTKYKTYF